MEIEPGQIFRPASLTTAELLGGREVLQVVVVGVDLDGVRRTLQVGTPLFEGLEDSKQFLVVDIVV